MKKKLLLVSGIAGLVATAALALLAVPVSFDRVQKRYPGSVQASSESVSFSLQQRLLSRQAEYRTDDDLQTVRGWYAALLDVHPASDANLLTSGSCAWITKDQRTILLNHSVSVLACSVVRGTQIAINEKIFLWPWPKTKR